MVFEAQAAVEMAKLAWHYRALAQTRVHFENPIMLFPGFGTSGHSLFALKKFLISIGAEVLDWELGLNHGDVPKLLPQVIERVKNAAALQKKSIHLIGWSLGGYLAREAAREAPDAVAKIVTLGSPVIGGPKYTSIGTMYTRWGFVLDEMERDIDARETRPIQKPIRAFYSKADNIVAWQACIDQISPHVQHDEVQGSHVGLIFNVEVFRGVRDFLRSTGHIQPQN